MTAPKLTALGRVLEVGDGRVVVESDFGRANVAARREAARAYAAMLYQPNAVRITIEATDADASAPLRSAEEIAREMVPPEQVIEDPNGQVIALMHDASSERPAALPRFSRPSAVSDLRAFLVRLIERSRSEGAAAERERLRDASPIALRKPTEVRVGQVWRRIETLIEGPPHRGRDLEVVHIDNGIAKLGTDGSVLCETRYMLELDAWLFIREPRDLAGRIRALVQEYAGRWADVSGVRDGEAMAEVVDRLVYIAGVLRRGVPVTKCLDDMRRVAADAPWREAVLEAADDLERIVSECAAQEPR